MEDIHTYLSSVLAVSVASIAAYVFTSYLNFLSAQNDLIKDYIADLDEIEVLCAEYWLNKSTHENNREQISHKLRAKLDATTYYEQLTKTILKSRFERFRDLDLELFVAATGGTFQTANFEVSPETYGEITSIIFEMRCILRQRRKSMFWAD